MLHKYFIRTIMGFSILMTALYAQHEMSMTRAVIDKESDYKIMFGYFLSNTDINPDDILMIEYRMYQNTPGEHDELIVYPRNGDKFAPSLYKVSDYPQMGSDETFGIGIGATQLNIIKNIIQKYGRKYYFNTGTKTWETLTLEYQNKKHFLFKDGLSPQFVERIKQDSIFRIEIEDSQRELYTRNDLDLMSKYIDLLSVDTIYFVPQEMPSKMLNVYEDEISETIEEVYTADVQVPLYKKRFEVENPWTGEKTGTYVFVPDSGKMFTMTYDIPDSNWRRIVRDGEEIKVASPKTMADPKTMPPSISALLGVLIGSFLFAVL